MLFFKTVLFSLIVVGVGFGHASPTKRQCQAALTTAIATAHSLQNHYYSTSSGMYNNGELWTDANTLEDLHNLMLGANVDDFSTVADNSYIGRQALNSNTNWNNVLAGSNDDAQWIILALWKIADYKSARGLSNSAYLSSAARIYDIIAGQWDNTCNGGLWWSTAHTYKNAVTNELFLYTSADGYLRNGNQTYLANAKKVWTWLNNSGIRNSQGLYNDGLSNSCTNNGQTTWIYNQGVIASGLGALYKATGDNTLLTAAQTTLDATISYLTVNNILKESCDNASSSSGACDHDQQIFKGIWTKHVQYFLDNANSATLNSKYSGFLGSQSSAVYHYGTNSNGDVGSVWYAPNGGGSVFSPEASASGLAALVSAAKYGPC